MSKHPDNPFWHDANDVPFEISSQADWDRAQAGGWITPEHVLLRLEAMLRVALGQPAFNGVGYDEDGFQRAVVAAGWQVDDCRMQLHSDDHEPPHLHFFLKGDPDYNVRLSLETAEPLPGERLTPELRKRLKKKVAPFMQENQAMLLAKWDETQN